jgi:hypothetical protein
MKKEEKVVRWIGNDGQTYVIHNVPTYQCDEPDCDEEYEPGKISMMLSAIADLMEEGRLPDTVDFRRFKQ